MAAKLCQKCKGTGEIAVTTCDPFDQFNPSTPCRVTWIKCKDCNGVGYRKV